MQAPTSFKMLVEFLRVQCVRHWFACSFGAILCLSVGFVLLDVQVGQYQIGRRFVHDSYDMLFRFRLPELQPEVAIIYMDDRSREELQQPADALWDRTLHAQLLDRLTQEGAKAVVFDVLFVEPGDQQADDQLAAAMRRNGKVVLGAELLVGGALTPQENWQVQDAMKVLPPADIFRDAAAGVGLVMLETDGERSVRKHFHGTKAGKENQDLRQMRLPSLSWAAAEIAADGPLDDPEAERWVHYYGPPGASFPYAVSYYQAILTNHLPKGYFHDKYVFIGAKQGTSYSGTGLDEFKSPYVGQGGLTRLYYPGVEVHATIFTNLIQRDWLRRFDPMSELILASAFGLLFGYLVTAFRPIWSILALVLSALAIGAFSLIIMLETHTWFAWEILCLQAATGAVWSFGFNSLQLFVQKKLLEQTLALHLSPSRVGQLLTRPEILKPGAEKQELTIVFTDIENFTTLAEHLDSDELAHMMNSYFDTAVSKCIHPADGTVLKYIGDAIFAIWNAPLPQTDHRAMACKAALLLQNEKLEFASGGKTFHLATRVGIHTGVANVGNFGSSTRIDYSAIGENVNLASRIEGLNKHLRTQILITEETNRALPEEIIRRRVGRFRLKGFEKAVTVYELLALNSSTPAPPWLEASRLGLERFENSQFEEAAALFEKAIKSRGDDGVARFYLEQIQRFRTEHPPLGWHGEILMTEK